MIAISNKQLYPIIDKALYQAITSLTRVLIVLLRVGKMIKNVIWIYLRNYVIV